MSKVAGRIEKADLAQIFARAERLRRERGSGRLGRAMLEELLARAKQVHKAPSTAKLSRLQLQDPPLGSPQPLGGPPQAPPPPPTFQPHSSSDELGVLPEIPPTPDDPRAQPKAPPSLRQLSALLVERPRPAQGAGGLDTILAQATELTFEGYEEELASLLEETYSRYERGSFSLFEPPPAAPAFPEPILSEPILSEPPRAAPLADWRPPPLELPQGAPPPPQASDPIHDPFAGDPFELAARPDPGEETRRAFGEQLARHGAPGMLERQSGGSVPIRVVYDGGRGLFGAPLEPVFSPGDRFQLRDGQIYRVASVEVVRVQTSACYQEVRAEDLGSLRAPLHQSWEGRFPPS